MFVVSLSVLSVSYWVCTFKQALYLGFCNICIVIEDKVCVKYISRPVTDDYDDDFWCNDDNYDDNDNDYDNDDDDDVTAYQ